MAATPDEQAGFASDDDVPIRYMARTRAYYAAIGYTTPVSLGALCRSAVPAAAPAAVALARRASITTAAPFDPSKGDQGPGAPYNGSAKFYQVYADDIAKPYDLRISHIAYDRVHTTATDSDSWFPLPQLQRFAATAGSARSRRASSARRPIAAIASRSRPTRRRSWRAAAPTASMPRCWCRTARSATRPSAWWRAISKPTASPPW